MNKTTKRKADFSQAALEAFRKRSRAIKYRGATVECIPVKEIVHGQESDLGRVDVVIAYREDGGRVVLRVHIWDDRWLWIDVRRSAKSGWIWEYTTEGRFIASSGARGLVERTEQTMNVTSVPADRVADSVASIWAPYLATGPRAL